MVQLKGVKAAQKRDGVTPAYVFVTCAGTERRLLLYPVGKANKIIPYNHFNAPHLDIESIQVVL
jgi:hypothetical protein